MEKIGGAQGLVEFSSGQLPLFQYFGGNVSDYQTYWVGYKKCWFSQYQLQVVLDATLFKGRNASRVHCVSTNYGLVGPQCIGGVKNIRYEGVQKKYDKGGFFIGLTS